MPNEVYTISRIRKYLESIDPTAQDTPQQDTLNEFLETLIAPSASPWGELTRAGRAFETHTTTAVAAVVARPTTAVMLAVYNNEPDGGRSYIIDHAWALLEAGTAAAGQFTILQALGQVREAVPTDAALAINQRNGMGHKDTLARTILNATALPGTTGIAGNWSVAPGQTSTGKPGAGATPGGFAQAAIDGRVIVPPGRYYALHVMADVIGSTFTVGLGWHERRFYALG